MTKNQRIKEIKREIRFFKMQLNELLLESGELTEIKRLAITINLRKLNELEEELTQLLED
jgi:hypothetical protein